MYLCVYLNWNWNIVSDLDFRFAIDSRNIFLFYFHSNFVSRCILLVNSEAVFGFSVSVSEIGIVVEISVRVLVRVPGLLIVFFAGVDVMRSSRRRGKMWR